MPLSNMMDTLRLKKLFERAEAGDPQAKQEVQGFQDSVELTGAGAQAKPDWEVPLASLMQSLPQAQSSPALGATPTFAPSRPEVSVEGDFSKPKRDWGGILKNASILLSDFGRTGKGMQGVEAPSHVQRFKQEQLDQLNRRHSMWEGAFQQSQALPPEVLTDPKFASLAQAKVALDKDMQDGKVDNEKNVSMFLTEVQRFRPELEQVGMLTKVKQQVAGEGLLQKEREAQGLAQPMEQKGEYNYEGTPVTRSEYLKLSSDREQKREERAFRLAQLEEQIRGRKAVAGINQQGRQDTLDDQKRRRTMANINNLVQNQIRLFPEVDEETGKPVVTERSLVKAVMQNKEAILRAAQAIGVDIQPPNYVDPTNAGKWIVEGQAFDPRTDEADMLMFLYQAMQSE